MNLTKYCSLNSLFIVAQAFIHVSTAFSYVDREEIDEVIYCPKMNPIKLYEFIEDADDALLESISKE